MVPWKPKAGPWGTAPPSELLADVKDFWNQNLGQHWRRVMEHFTSSSDGLEVRLGLVGQGESGKTCMLNGIRRILFDIDLGPELEFGKSAEGIKKLIYERNQAEQILTKNNALARTTEAGDFDFDVFDGSSKIMTFIYHDAIGQLFQDVELGKEDRQRHTFLMKTLTQADVLWAIIGVRKGLKGPDFDTDEVEIVKGYVREAIKNRSGVHKISVGIVLTKADAAGDDEESEATRKNLNKLMDKAASRFSTLLERESKVWSACVFPVSSFGFGTSEDRDNVSTFSRDNARKAVLTNGRLQPWNIEKLLLWSLICGLEQPRPRRSEELDGLDLAVSRRLSPALNRMTGPIKIIKAIR